MPVPSCLVVSSYESELQPVAAASTVAAMRREGIEVQGWDAHMFPDACPEGPFDLVLLSVQQYAGLDRSIELLDWATDKSVARRTVAFGQYAQMNSRAFLGRVDAIAMDEPERLAEGLAGLASGTAAPDEVRGLLSRDGSRPRPPNTRMTWASPDRSVFPSIVEYPAHQTPFGLMGNIEVSRGCHHKCTYCSVYGAYEGRFTPITVDAVVADAIVLVEQGAKHFAFIDAEFFNSSRLGIETIEGINAACGPSTFEITTRVDHILQYSSEIEYLVSLGLRTITSALEFPSDRILRVFDKGINVADTRRAIALTEELGVTLNPTFIPFTPWVTYEELLGFEEFLVDTGLSRTAAPTVLQTRLLLFKGSPLLSSPWVDGLQLEDRGFYYEWRHPDPRVEALWQERRDEAVNVGEVRCCVKC
ncbi:MAG: radical SAM protein [Pseudonocardiaceae bacterium]